MSTAVSQNINSAFFDGIYKEVWRSLIPAGLSQAEADFIMEAASLEQGSQVLDIMCGYGRHAIELARRGVAVTAIDNAKDYIVEIETVKNKEDLPLTPVAADVTGVSLQGTYDAAICMGNSFAFFNEAEALSVLKNLSAHLKKGGAFIINTWMIAEIAIRHFKEKDFSVFQGYKYLQENEYLFNPSRIETDHIIITENGEMETIKGIDYIFTISELQALLKEASFEWVDIFSTPRKRKFVLGDGRAYILVRKS